MSATPEVPIPNPPISGEEKTAADLLSEQDLEAIDACILSRNHAVPGSLSHAKTQRRQVGKRISSGLLGHQTVRAAAVEAGSSALCIFAALRLCVKTVWNRHNQVVPATDRCSRLSEVGAIGRSWRHSAFGDSSRAGLQVKRVNTHMNTRSIAFRIGTLAVAAFIAGAGCSDSSKHSPNSQSASETSIVVEPRVRVGKVRAGMTIQQVVAELGEPDNKTGHILNYVRSGFSVAPNREGTVVVVSCGDTLGTGTVLVKAFKGRTKEGIGMDSSRADVIRAYGEPTEIDRSYPGHEALKYQPLGLDFTLQNGKVHHMVVNLRPAK